jgi:FecR protein
MLINPAITTMALAVLMLGGLSSPAQEPVAPNNDAQTNGAPAAQASAPPAAAPASGNSKVRIIRLSEIKGQVQFDRNIGNGFEAAIPNLPVTEGDKLKTEDGVAEIEFEDNSTIRVAQNSEVEFPLLELLPTGAKSSTVNVLRGMVYVNLVKTKGNQFTVKFGPQTVNLPPDSHVRLQVTLNEAKLAVMHGDAEVLDASGTTTVNKNKTMTYNLAEQTPPVLAKNVAALPTDSWDHDAVQYHQSFANASAYGGTPYAYGVNDLNYYGGFVNGCGGSMWRPYFTSAAWDPYGSGAWAYYPSAGYSWVSPYPWGWTPYHYGSWSFCQGVGWGWRPGGAWMGLANNTFVAPGGSALASAPGRPTHPPLVPPSAARTSTLVPVNMKAIPASGLGTAHDAFVFRGNSAGMGVPRGSLGNLHSFSGQTARQGSVSTPVYSGVQRSAAGGEARMGGGGPSTISPAYGPSRSAGPSMQSAPGGGGGGGGAHTSVQSAAPSGGGGRR